MADDIEKRLEKKLADEKSLPEYLQNLKEIKKIEEKLLEIEIERNKERKRLLESLGVLTKEQEKELKQREKNVILLEEELEKRKQSTQNYKELADAAKNFANSLGGISGKLQQISAFDPGMKNLSKSFLNLGGAIMKSTYNAVTNAAKGFKDFVKKANIARKGVGLLSVAIRGLKAAATFGLSLLVEGISTLVGVVYGAGLEILMFADGAGASFARLTGTTDRFNETLLASADSAYKLGVSSETLAKINADLVQDFSSFRNTSVGVTSEMAKQVVMMDLLGVSSKSQIAVMDSLNRVMGMSAEESMKFTKELYDMAGAANMAPQEMVASFQNALPTLSVYGSSARNEFIKLSSQSKATGMSVKELLDITAKFDTFEGAANAAQGLNAFLGGPYLNTIELLTATESERIDLLRDAMQESGKEFADLDRFAQKGIAKQLGMSLEQARRQFSMSAEEVAEYNKQMEFAAELNTNLEERAARTQPIMDTLKTAFKDVALAVFESATGFDSSGGAMKNAAEVMQFVYKNVIPKLISGFIGLVDILSSALYGVLDIAQFFVIGETDKKLERAKEGIEGFQRGLPEIENKLIERMEAIGDAQGGVKVNQKQNDFIFSKGTVTPIDSRDQFMGVKPTGYFDTSQKEMGRKMEELTNAINRLADSSGNSGQKIEMDGRVVAEIIDRRIQDKYSFNLPSSGRIR